MAEIKSTMEMVLERAAAMGKASKAEMDVEEQTRKGMRLAADYLAGRQPSMAQDLGVETESERTLVRQGVVRVFLRNIVLPRDDDSATAEQAMRGLLEIGLGAPDLQAIFAEMQQLFTHYLQHQQQLRQQLEDAMRQQLEQAMAMQSGQAGREAGMDPTLHPKFQEEWQRLHSELVEQYGQALEQHKAIVAQRFGL